MDVFSLAAEFPNDNPALHRGVSWVCLEVTGAAVAVHEALAIVEAVAEPPAPDTAIDEPPVPAARISGIVALGDTPRLDLDRDLDLDLDRESTDDLATLAALARRFDALAERIETLADADDDAPIVVEDLPPLEESASLEGVITSEASDAATSLDGVIACEAPGSLDAPDTVAESATTLPPACDDPFTILLSALADILIGAGSPYAASVLPGLLLDGTLAHPLPDDAAQSLAEANMVVDSAVTPAFRAQTLAWRAILLGTSDDFEACGGAMLDEWAADVLARLLGAPTRSAALRRELRSHGVAAFGLVEAA